MMMPRRMQAADNDDDEFEGWMHREEGQICQTSGSPPDKSLNSNSMPDSNEGPQDQDYDVDGVLPPQQRPRKNALVIETEESEVNLEVLDKQEEEQKQPEEGEADPFINSNNNEDTARDNESSQMIDSTEELDRILELDPTVTSRTYNKMSSSSGGNNGISFVANNPQAAVVSPGRPSMMALRQNSSASSIVARSKREVRNDPAIDIEEWKKRGSDAAQDVISTLYCKILIVFGLAFPMSEVIATSIPQSYFQIFYVYLFLGSLLFLVYIYVELVRERAKMAVKRRSGIKAWMVRVKGWMVATTTRGRTGGEGGGGNGLSDDYEHSLELEEDRLFPRPKQIYGSFYIRMGAVLFGIGSMIYSGIEIGIFFEVGFHIEECKDGLVLVRPFLQMVFVFVQMYFIFLNHKLNLYRSKSMSRFGLMHMIATNLCVWFNVLITETYHEIVDLRKHDKINGTAFDHEDSTHGISCLHSEVMGRLLAKSGPFLFPCTIEYSLISAAVLYMMFKNIAEEHEHYVSSKRRSKICVRMHIPLGPNVEDLPRNYYSVDCSNANNGLFSGIFVMVCTIISLIVFFVLIHSENEHLHNAAINVASLTELALYSLTTIAVIIGMVQIRALWYDSAKKLELDNLLLIVAQTGVLIYSSFCIIGSFFQLREHLTSFLSSVMTLVQTTMQTIFILDASNRFAYCAEQVRSKPGRQVVTFLLVCNLAMWAINTLETNRADSHPIQVKFYGGNWVWPIITHVSMPLAIFYRFHSTVCLCEIWTKTFKYKEYNVYA